MEKRQIRGVSSEQGKRYSSSRRELEARLKRVAAGTIAAAMVFGGVATTAIPKIVRDIQKSGTKEAIEMAGDYFEKISEIEQIMETHREGGEEQAEELEQLSQAAIDYQKLRYVSNRTLQQEKRYVEACEIISNSKDLVIDTYEAIIIEKVAEAYGIEDPEEIKAMEIHDYIHEVGEHGPTVIMPDGNRIAEKYFLSFSSKETLNNELGNVIIDARQLRDVPAKINDDGTYMNMKEIEDSNDKIVKTYMNAMKFHEKYKVYVNEKGQLVAEEIEEQEVSTPTREDEER